MISRFAFGSVSAAARRRRRSDLRWSARYGQPVVDQHLHLPPKLMLTPGSCLVPDGAMTLHAYGSARRFRWSSPPVCCGPSKISGPCLGRPTTPLTLLSATTPEETALRSRIRKDRPGGLRSRIRGTATSARRRRGQRRIGRPYAGRAYPRRRDGADWITDVRAAGHLLRSCPMLSGVIATRLCARGPSPTKW